MMYDVTRFDGGVRHTGVCHLTPDIWRGSVTMPSAGVGTHTSPASL